MSHKNVNITKSQFNLLIQKCKIIGQGREGMVYKFSTDVLYKIYYNVTETQRELKKEEYIKDYIIDENNVKKIISDNKHLETTNNFISVGAYTTDNDGTKRILPKDQNNQIPAYSIRQISASIERQKNIKLSSLPIAPIYVDNRLAGVVIRRFKNYYAFHKIINFFPRKKKIEIFEDILEKLRELTENYIYPTDFGNITEGVNPHSNILLNLKGIPEFIDLDGNSTSYAFKEDSYKEASSYSEFYVLFLSIIYNIEIPRNFMQEDFDYISNQLINKGLPLEYAELIKNQDNCNNQNMKEMIAFYKKENYRSAKKK